MPKELDSPFGAPAYASGPLSVGALRASGQTDVGKLVAPPVTYAPPVQMADLKSYKAPETLADKAAALTKRASDSLKSLFGGAATPVAAPIVTGGRAAELESGLDALEKRSTSAPTLYQQRTAFAALAAPVAPMTPITSVAKPLSPFQMKAEQLITQK